MKWKQSVRLMCILSCVSLFSLEHQVCYGFSGLQVQVEVIKAERDSKVVDPQLKDLVKELAPVLNYSGFSLMKKAEIHLKAGAKGDVILSRKRVLELQFMGFEGDQARLLVTIVENGKETFHTTLLLVDKGNVLIGGPPHENGVLLLRIGGKFK